MSASRISSYLAMRRDTSVTSAPITLANYHDRTKQEILADLLEHDRCAILSDRTAKTYTTFYKRTNRFSGLSKEIDFALMKDYLAPATMARYVICSGMMGLTLAFLLTSIVYSIFDGKLSAHLNEQLGEFYNTLEVGISNKDHLSDNNSSILSCSNITTMWFSPRRMCEIYNYRASINNTTDIPSFCLDLFTATYENRIVRDACAEIFFNTACSSDAYMDFLQSKRFLCNISTYIIYPIDVIVIFILTEILWAESSFRRNSNVKVNSNRLKSDATHAANELGIHDRILRQPIQTFTSKMTEVIGEKIDSVRKLYNLLHLRDNPSSLFYKHGVMVDDVFHSELLPRVQGGKNTMRLDA